MVDRSTAQFASRFIINPLGSTVGLNYTRICTANGSRRRLTVMANGFTAFVFQWRGSTGGNALGFNIYPPGGFVEFDYLNDPEWVVMEWGGVTFTATPAAYISIEEIAG